MYIQSFDEGEFEMNDVWYLQEKFEIDLAMNELTPELRSIYKKTIKSLSKLERELCKKS